jgi:hypothetical protein
VKREGKRYAEREEEGKWGCRSKKKKVKEHEKKGRESRNKTKQLQINAQTYPQNQRNEKNQTIKKRTHTPI